MSLNIKNEETCRLAEELADLMGESKTGAITTALRERLDRERREKERQQRSVEALAEELVEMGRQLAATLLERGLELDEGEELSITHGDLLYDEHGLPK